VIPVADLEVRNLHVRLEGAHILQGINISVPERRAIVLLGHNGAGKTTLVRSIMGLVGPIDGGIYWRGADITASPPWKRVEYGISYVPQSRRLFPSLSVDEHLEIAKRAPRPDIRAWTREELYELFPNLKQRRNSRGGLSGGEQQMLAIARALIANPCTIILDEPSEGLAPSIVSRLVDILEQLKRDGIGILLVEQDFRIAARIADTIYIQQAGLVVFQGSGLSESDVASEIEKTMNLQAG
jgi:branched-chain amino acid transport system ATP-binding protein